MPRSHKFCKSSKLQMNQRASSYKGACLCGQVEFELAGEPLTFYVCHCTVCQRRTGGAALPVMLVPRTHLHILSGEAPLVEFQVNEKHRRRSRICPRCDTRLWAEPLEKPNISILRPGNLYDQRSFEPVADVYTRSKQSWFLIPDSVAQFETYPADPEMLITLWRQGRRSGAGD